MAWEFVLVSGKQNNTWQAQFEARICRPGALCKCRQCDPFAANTVEERNTHACSLCKLQLTQEFYSAAMWHDRAKASTKRTLCKKCFQSKCTNPNCHTTSSIHHSAYPRTPEERDNWLCRVCSKGKTYPCELCGIRQPQENYSVTMWNNRLWKKTAPARTLCNDCCQPKCGNPDCTQQHEKIHHKIYPQTLMECDNWYCEECKHNCDLCGEQQSADKYSNSM